MKVSTMPTCVIDGALDQLTSYFAPVQVLMGALLLLVVMMSSFSTVYVKYMNRELTDQLDQLKNAAVSQENEYSQLVLEQAALTNQGRVQRLAQEKLGLVMPNIKDMYTLEK